MAEVQGIQLTDHGRAVWLLTTGNGDDGDEWSVEGIYATEEAADIAKAEYEKPYTRPDGSTYFFPAAVEQWPILGVPLCECGKPQIYNDIAKRHCGCCEDCMPF